MQLLCSSKSTILVEIKIDESLKHTLTKSHWDKSSSQLHGYWHSDLGSTLLANLAAPSSSCAVFIFPELMGSTSYNTVQCRIPEFETLENQGKGRVSNESDFIYWFHGWGYEGIYNQMLKTVYGISDAAKCQILECSFSYATRWYSYRGRKARRISVCNV